ncbi:MAG: arginine deiminase family protein [Paludibacteraceae bacterium]|nr:arginine deiminase family protein [Paludibacteraceae bacterium]
MKKVFLYISVLLFVACQRSNHPDITDKPYCPQAEWDKAVTILMHTPGIELFDGVAHPTAGLFEHYFNVDSAAAEHRHYIEMLRANHIQVYTVEDILQQMDIDVLRSLAAQVLTYDVSALSPEDAEEVGENYRQQTLREMSRNDLIRCLLLQPTIRLRKTELNTGYEAVYEHNSLMNLYFTRDQSINTPKGQVICKMNSTQRAPETRIIRACYEALGLTPIYEIEGDGRMEGGDYIPAGTVSFIGQGMRTNAEAIDQMLARDVFGHDTVVVAKQHCRWQLEMHLDTYFNIIDKDLCTMVARRQDAPVGDPYYVSADIYVRAPGEKNYRLEAEDVSFVDLLHQRGFTIIPIEEADELHYANNYLTIAPRHIMAVGGQSKALQDAFKAHGVKVEWVPLEQLICGYGAAHCMTQVMQRRN